MDIQEKIRVLTEDKEFVEAFQKTTNAQEVVDLYARYDVEIPVEIAQELFEQDMCELNEEELNEVAGGGLISFGVSCVYYGAGYLGARLAGWSKSKSKSYAKKCKAVGSVIGKVLEWAL